MDGSQFDALSRALAGGRSRRGLSRLLGGLALGGPLGVLGLAETEGKRKKKKKKAQKKRCSAGNPIRCGKFCCRPDEACQNGTCVSHCFDGERNFGEADTDCGRVCKERHRDHGLLCGLDRRCAGPEDCLSFVCAERQPGAGTVCVECDVDSRCQVLGLGRRCVERTCVECAADFDCPGERPFCVAADGCPNNEPCACGTCREDGDCPDGQVCDERGRCFECFEDADCTGDPGRPVCVDNVCQQCVQDTDCPTVGDVCILNACRTPAVCPAGRDLCTQGFGAGTSCGSGSSCRCRTTTEGETRCASSLEVRCDAQPACTSRAQCEARHGPGAFCVQDTGSFCGCAGCARQCA